MQKSLKSITFMLLLLFIPACLFAQEYTAKVVGVSDGDTITALKNGSEQIKIRLAEIDCPKRGQDFSNVAKKFVSDLSFGKEVRIIPSITVRI